MVFSPKIKEKVLVASRRSCSVCHQFKGVAVEVHHIILESKGGENTFENAIALCFDCHMAAGHYNPEHPRGTKFSPSELKKHRDNWYQAVASGLGLPTSIEINNMGYVRYIVCTDYEVAREFFSHNWEGLPFNIKYLQNGPLLDFMKMVTKDGVRRPWAESSHYSDSYYNYDKKCNSLDEFLKDNPDLVESEKRLLTKEDFLEGIIAEEFLVQGVKEGFEPSKLGYVNRFFEACGGSGWVKEYVVRRPVFVFAEFKNISKNPVTVNALLARPEIPSGINIRDHRLFSTEVKREAIAPITLMPNESVFFPEGIFLPPIGDRYSDHIYEEQKISPTHDCLNFVAYKLRNDFADDYLLMGPRMGLEGFFVDYEGQESIFPIHNFDPNKCYSFHRAWEIGSCPHLFFLSNYEQWEYFGEILIKANGYENLSTQCLIIPQNIKIARIAELDYEVTHLILILKNGNPISFDKNKLRRGDFIDISVKEGDFMSITGFYRSRFKAPKNWEQVQFKRDLLRGYIYEQNVTKQ